MAESGRRLAHLRDDPRVALTVLGKDDWSRHVSLTGAWLRWRIEIDSWHAWAGAQPWTG